MDLIIVAVAFVFGSWLGYRVSEWIFLLSMKDLIEDLGITEEQLRRVAEKKGLELERLTGKPAAKLPPSESTLTPIEIKLEEHQGQIYAFRMDNDQFLGQGANRDELIARLAERMTNVRLIVSEGSELINQTS